MLQVLKTIFEIIS